MSTIFCPLCYQHLAASRFYPAVAKPGVRRAACIECHRIRSRDWAKRNRLRLRMERLQAAPPESERRIECRKCFQHLPLDQFYKRYVGPYTKRGKCRKCSVADARKWVLSNPERAAAWRAESPKLKSWIVQWNKKNRENINRTRKKWCDKNREAMRAVSNDKNASARGARTPPWADKAAIRAIYREAARLTRETGIKHHVDHVIPIKGKNVCGLHVETNLQILTATQNIRKSNRVLAPAGHVT